MSTIATNILRDLDARLTFMDGNSEGGNPEASIGDPSARKLLLELCEAAEGIRLGPSAWIFADGSELQV